ncbi:MAG TPA: hypothetical protein VHD55_01765 [Candidatus Paceibacterota bacterium]|nr:hypothetical protein [Candidatus Paceibacterota bacterium]
MLYTHGRKDFRHHVHPTLQRRLRMFFIIGGITLAVVGWDIVQGAITVPVALASIAVGTVVGWFTSRIFHLSWNEDGQRVVGRIDKIGWFVLVAYIVFEVSRAVFFDVVHTGLDATAITFAFVSSALLSRMFGLRGRIVKILKEEKIFG